MGLPTVFIRLTGCPLRCTYCDTAYAFHHGQRFTIQDVLLQTRRYSAQHVTVTGGEPLAQKNSLLLLKALCDEGYIVSLETSGALDIRQVDDRVVKIVDVKTPASAEADKNLWSNLKYLSSQDQIKFVICNRDDYVWSKKIITQYNLNSLATVLFSPSHNEQNPGLLADWILEDRLKVRMQIQLHKYLWGDVPGR